MIERSDTPREFAGHRMGSSPLPNKRKVPSRQEKRRDAGTCEGEGGCVEAVRWILP